VAESVSGRGTAGPGAVEVEIETTWVADIVVLPKPGVNDPEGEAVLGGLAALGYADVRRVRSGRFFRVAVAAPDADSARVTVAAMCDQLLANPVIEAYRVARVEAADPETAVDLDGVGDAQ